VPARYRPKPVFQLRRDPAHPTGSSLRSKNCNPAAGATLVDYVTCGARTTTGAAVRELTGDTVKGTSLRQVANAIDRGFGVELDLNSSSFARVVTALKAGRGVSLCGSSRVTRGTRWQASETFDGNHQWALTDIRQRDGREAELLVFDPLADGRRRKIARSPMWIPVSVVREFAGRLDLRSQEEIDARKPRRPLGLGKATYGVTAAVACSAGAHVTGPAVRHAGAKLINGHTGRDFVVKVPVGRVRARPTTRSPIVSRKRSGQIFHVHQQIDGQPVGGSPVWFGDRLGRRWMHASLLRRR
jgi:hypothetical protein